MSGEELDQLCEHLRLRLGELRLERSQDGATQAWAEFCDQLEKNAESDDPRKFLRWPVIETTMNISANYVDLEFDHVRSHPLYRSLWRPGLQEIQLGDPIPYWRFPKTSPNTIHHVYHLCRFWDAMRTKIDDIPLVFEFGGGYGNFSRVMFNLGFKGRYVIFDLPHFSALQSFYLGAAGLNVDCVSLPDEADRILKSANLEKTLFVATWSLSETPLGSREWIKNDLRRFGHLLVSYQNTFCGIDNVAYFDGLRRELGASHNVSIELITHLPGSQYFFGRAAR